MEIVEDDLFFADLSKRISLLIMDDDEDPTLHCPPVSFQVLSQTIHPIHNQIPSYHEQNGSRRESSKGTGVFIPRSSNNPRRSKQSRSKSSNNKVQTQRHVDTSNGHFAHESYHNNHNTTSTNTYNSLNHKRYY